MVNLTSYIPVSVYVNTHMSDRVQLSVYVPDVTHTKHGVHEVTLLVRFTLAPC